jgi:glycerate kinase
MNILIAPNSYKECIESVRIAQIIQREISKKPQFNLIMKPLSDGGDGFRGVYSFMKQINTVNDYKVINYDNHLLDYLCTYSHNDKSIIIESAELFGLKSIPKSKQNPLIINSELLGKIIKYLSIEGSENRLEIDKVYIGVGGTATVDFGIGTCSQLGLLLYDENDEEIEPLTLNFSKAKKITFTKKQLPFKIKCIVDVETELIGNPGAIEIYGKQKGAIENDLAIIKKGIKNILVLIQRDLGIKIPEKLNGAGGGLAAGLNLFYDAEIIPAKVFIENNLLADIDLDKIDVVITGEGSFDNQSFEGKGSGVILDLFKDKQAMIFLVNGSTNLQSVYKLSKNVRVINLVDFFESKTESMKNVESGLKKACEIILDQLCK